MTLERDVGRWVSDAAARVVVGRVAARRGEERADLEVGTLEVDVVEPLRWTGEARCALPYERQADAALRRRSGDPWDGLDLEAGRHHVWALDAAGAPRLAVNVGGPDDPIVADLREAVAIVHGPAGADPDRVAAALRAGRWRRDPVLAWLCRRPRAEAAAALERAVEAGAPDELVERLGWPPLFEAAARADRLNVACVAGLTRAALTDPRSLERLEACLVGARFHPDPAVRDRVALAIIIQLVDPAPERVVRELAKVIEATDDEALREQAARVQALWMAT